MPPTAGSSTADPVPVEARLYLELGSPECWLVAERVLNVLPFPAEWTPVAYGAPAHVDRESIEARAAEFALLRVRWPVAWPPDTDLALRCATFAKGTGRSVAFCLAAFRQAFNGGRDLSDPDTLAVIGAACELHPRALLAGAEGRGTRRTLATATAQAREAGVEELPAIVAGGRVFSGPDAPERAAAAVAAPSA